MPRDVLAWGTAEDGLEWVRTRTNGYLVIDDWSVVYGDGPTLEMAIEDYWDSIHSYCEITTDAHLEGCLDTKRWAALKRKDRLNATARA